MGVTRFAMHHSGEHQLSIFRSHREHGASDAEVQIEFAPLHRLELQQQLLSAHAFRE